MKVLKLNTACVLLLTVGGCGQILGISSYDIDPKLDGTGAKQNAAGDGGDGGDVTKGGKGGTSEEGGKAGTAGTAGSLNPDAGAPPFMQGGQGGVPVVTAGQAGESMGGGGAGGAGGDGEILVDCASLDCCTQAGGVAKPSKLGPSVQQDGELLEHGDFESASAWYEDSTNFDSLITYQEDPGPYSGTYYAWLGGILNEESIMESDQPFEVPADAGWFTLSGFRKFQLDGAVGDPLNTDSLEISLTDEDSIVETVVTWKQTPAACGVGAPTNCFASTPARCCVDQTSGWVEFTTSWDAAPHRGKQRYLYFVGTTDAYFTDTMIDGSNFMFDSVSLKAFACYK